MRLFRRSAPAMLLLSSMLLAAAACGAAERSAGLGLVVPVGSYGDAATAGYAAGAALRFDLLPDPIVGPKLQVGASAAFARCGLEDDFPVPGAGGHVNQLELLAVLRLTLPGGVFLEGGTGMTSVGGELAGGDIDVPDAYTYVLGAGKRFQLLEIGVAYHSADVDTGSLPVDLSWRYFTLGGSFVF